MPLRTPRDRYTPHRRFRIYNRNELLDEEQYELHEGGDWFVEPEDWPYARPAQLGYESLKHAYVEAVCAEHMILAFIKGSARRRARAS